MLRYLAKSSSNLLETPVKYLQISSLIHFISNRNKSVKLISVFNLSVRGKEPEVSIAVLIF